MSRNVFLDTGFSNEDATVYALEADSAAALARLIQMRYPGNQKAAARALGLHQSEVSALLSGNLGRRFSLSKLIRLARRARIRLYIDMGDSADGAVVSTLMPTVVPAPANVTNAEMPVELYSEAPGKVVATTKARTVVKTAEIKH
jgi:predicted XRE-type DNA-binding protein